MKINKLIHTIGNFAICHYFLVKVFTRRSDRKKKKGSDEFLVQKKNPLVKPDFDDASSKTDSKKTNSSDNSN